MYKCKNVKCRNVFFVKSVPGPGAGVPLVGADGHVGVVLVVVPHRRPVGPDAQALAHRRVVLLLAAGAVNVLLANPGVGEALPPLAVERRIHIIQNIETTYNAKRTQKKQKN